MNLHMPQDVEAESELLNLAAVPYQIISPANNASIIGIFQDSLLGAYRFTREGIQFSPRDAMNLLMLFPRVNESTILEKAERGETISNFEILSQILPPISMKYNTKLFKDDEKEATSNNVLEIRNGKIMRGQLEKGVLGGGSRGLIHRIYNDYGVRASADFIDNLQNIITEYMKSSAYSVGISDLIADKATNQKIVDVITEKKKDVKNVIDQIQIGVFENKTGKTNQEEFETQVNNILNQASAEAGKIGLKSLGKDNRFVTMVNAGSKGSDLNISFMISCLGQQNVDGKRIPYGFEHRTLPHFAKYDDSPVARGFVESSYINGLSPQELFFHAMGGRVGLIDTAVKSVTWETPIVVIENGQPVYTEIGRWIDGYLDDPTNQPNVTKYDETQRNMELLEIEEGKMYIPTTDENGVVTWGPITAMTRHDPGTELYEIKTSGGRTVTVTESKSLLVWNPETKQFLEKPTPEIKVGDFVPVTCKLGFPTNKVDIDMSYEKSKTYIDKAYEVGKKMAELNMDPDIYLNSFYFVYPTNICQALYDGFRDHKKTYYTSRRLLEDIAMIMSRIGLYGAIEETYSGYFKLIELVEPMIQNDVVLDPIVEINVIGVEKHPKVYDLTIPETFNFGLANGLQVRDTSSTGYIQRRLIKGMEDLMVSYDMTVRNNKNKIVQFSYGDDSIDPVKVETQSVPLVNMSIQDIYAHYNIPEDKQNAKVLGAIFVKSALTRHKKQLNEWLQKSKLLTDMMIQDRDLIVQNIFKYKSDSVVNSPVGFAHVINNIKGQMNLNQDSVVDITLMEAVTMLDETYAGLEKIRSAIPTPLFKTLFYWYLSPKDLLIVKRFNRTALTLLLETIVINYKKAIVAPGEMVGMIAAQSIGEPTTQMSLPYHEQVRVVKVNKRTGATELCTLPIGKICDTLIHQNPDTTLETGHGVNSVETQIDHLDTAYYIVGVDESEQTSWNRISHVSRHPVNGQLMRVKTKSGRVVETTTSHSHLVRSQTLQKVVPMVGADLKTGMRIPVCKYVQNAFEQTSLSIHIHKNGQTQTIVQPLTLSFGTLIGSFMSQHNSPQQFLEENRDAYSVVEDLGHTTQILGHIHTTCNMKSSKRVPDFMFTAPEECKAGFLRAYFDAAAQFQCDNKHYQIRLSSHRLQWIKDIATLLSQFSIVAYINTKSSSKVIHMYIAAKYAPIYQEKIGSKTQQIGLKSIVEYATRTDAHDLSEEIDKISGLGDLIAHCGAALKLPGHSRNFGRWAKKDSIGRRTLIKYIQIFEGATSGQSVIEKELAILKQAATSTVLWDEIVDIEIWTPDVEEFVYDFTVPGCQTFMTDNNVIVHNTLNSVTFETPIIVRNRDGFIQKVQIGEFIEKHIANPKKLEYYENKDTTYAEMNEYFEVPSCTEDGEVVWKEIEAVTRHPVINKDGTNTMIKVTTEENREVIATKAKSFLKLVNGKLIAYEGENLKVGDYVPISTKQIEFSESRLLDLRRILPPTEYIYSSEVEKAKSVMNETCWWSKHNGSTFVLPYKRSDSFVAKVSEKLRSGCKSKTTFEPGCIYTLQTNMNDYMIPEVIPLDYNFGYLCGAYAAEGCMTKFQISIANNDSEYYGPILELCKQWNINTKVYRHENKGKEGWTSQDLRIYNTVLCRILENLCGKLSHNKFVSDKIVFSNKECILGFLDAYIGGDGSVDKKQKVISMSSVSKELLIDVQQMLNVIGNYSYITKYKKPESNNRGTLPENIRQMYNLRITGSQLYLLIPQLNIRLKYKQESLVELLKHEYIYDIHKNATLIPNEIDGEIVLEERMDGKYTDVLFDKIVSIEDVANTTNYAYDLTVKDTRTFLLHNGMLVYDTFHFAGVSSKSNVTRGVPRIEEILSLSADPKNPSLTIYLKPEEQTDREKAQNIMYMLEHTKLKELVISSEICFDPDDLNTLIAEDTQTMEQYRAFENMVDECLSGAKSDQTSQPQSQEKEKSSDEDKSKWVVRIEMDPNMLLEKNITMDDIHFTINNSYGEDISCVYSDYNADKLIFRIRMNNLLKSAKGAKKTKVNPLDQSDHIYLLKNFQDQLLENLIIRGVKNIDKVILRKIKDNMTEKSGIYKKEDIWVLDTIGTNIIDVLALDYIDYKRTFSNDIIEIFNVFGIEAARQIIYNELVEVIEFDGTYINFHHLALLCDRMTSTSHLISIIRHGINNDNIGPIAKASFEETPEMFLKAARHAELDIMRGVSANVMCGQEGLFGTNSFQVVLDMEEMRKLEETTFAEKKMVSESIDALFGKLENPDDACSSNRLLIQNNVAAIKTKKVGGDNDYNPGF